MIKIAYHIDFPCVLCYNREDSNPSAKEDGAGMRRWLALALVLCLCWTAFSGLAEQLAPLKPGQPVVAPSGQVAKRISLARKKVTLGVGERFFLDPRALDRRGQETGGALSFASAKADVADVNADGVVEARKPGRTKITVRASGGVKAVCTVTVKRAPASMTVAARAPKLFVGRGTTLKVTFDKGSAAYGLAYSGYDASVVTVAENGAVKAVGPGQTAVTVTAYNGLTATCCLRVLEKGARRAVIVAHRGGAGDWPENSSRAFADATDSGANDVELDVRSTADGVQVVHHDATFVLRGRRYAVEQLTLEQLTALDEDICTLDEALRIVSDAGMGMELELKDSADPAACVKAVAAYGMEDRVCYIAFDAEKLAAVRALHPGAKVGLLFTRKPKDLEATLAALGPTVLSQQDAHLTRDDVLRWQNQGYLVGTWTVNDAEQLREWAEIGVDYITTDDPRMAVGIIDQ